MAVVGVDGTVRLICTLPGLTYEAVGLLAFWAALLAAHDQMSFRDPLQSKLVKHLS